MPQSKVTSVRHNGKTWPGQKGTMYVQEVAFEDGTSGEANAAEQVPWYKVGDLVEYTQTGEYQGTPKLSIKKIGGGNFGGGGYRGGGGHGGDSVGSMVGNAITNAINLIRDGKAKPHQGENLTQCLIRLGDDICAASEHLKKKYTPAKPAPQPQQQPAQQAQPQQGYQNQPHPASQASDGNTYEDDDVPF